MAWMSDEKYEYIQDCKEKKSIGASAFKARTHCGKGGSVKFPSDFMSKKELQAMNSECKSYRMNDPMSWEDFKSMPDDLKGRYIKGLREKFKVPDSKLAEVWGIMPPTLYKWIKLLGLSQGKAAGAAGRHWYNTDDCDRFNAWWFGVKLETAETPSVEPVEAVEQKHVEPAEGDIRIQYDVYEPGHEPERVVAHTTEIYMPFEEAIDKAFAKHAENIEDARDYLQSIPEPNPGPIAFTGHHMPVIPKKGTMTFERDLADDALDTIKCLLSNMRVNITISWECMFEDGAVCER